MSSPPPDDVDLDERIPDVHPPITVRRQAIVLDDPDLLRVEFDVERGEAPVRVVGWATRWFARNQVKLQSYGALTRREWAWIRARLNALAAAALPGWSQ